MKTLVLLRHAKSDWGYEALKDIDRHLNERGYEDAYFMSDWYEKNMLLPDLIISSSANRALNTAFIFARRFSIPESKVRIEEGIYESASPNLLNIISQLDNNNSCVMLFGHNPGITNLANELNKELMFDNIPTCGIVCIEFDIKNWKDILKVKEGKLVNYKFPKNFKQ